MDLTLQLKQQQKLVMTTQMQQAFHLLQLNGLELEDALMQELEENPALELVQDRPDILTEAELLQRTELQNQNIKESEIKNGSGEGEFDWQALLENGKAVSAKSHGMAGGYIYSDLPPIEQNLTASETLYNHLLEQFRLEFSTTGERRAGEFILGCLDRNGFLDASYEEVMDRTDTDLDDVEGAVLIIRELEPIGCGARNAVECLVFQAEINYPEDPFFVGIIQEHLEDLTKKKYDSIGNTIDMHPEDVEEYHKMLLEFNPKPGNAFSDSEDTSVTPDVKIIKVGEEWQVISNDDGMPRVRINSMLQKLIKEKKLEGKEKAFADDKLKKAQFFIESIYRREQTLLRVTRSILSRQLEYFEFGPEFLRPLVLRQVAEDVELHESTVSRSTANKYVEIPTGVIELKSLFCSGVSGMFGEEYAAEAIQFKIKRLVSQEDSKKPYSDQKIKDIFSAEGINIARRTVAKYGEIAGIGSSRARKKR
jgi:RNA polymerase sigma-54 factor